MKMNRIDYNKIPYPSVQFFMSGKPLWADFIKAKPLIPKKEIGNSDLIMQESDIQVKAVNVQAGLANDNIGGEKEKGGFEAEQGEGSEHTDVQDGVNAGNVVPELPDNESIPPEQTCTEEGINPIDKLEKIYSLYVSGR